MTNAQKIAVLVDEKTAVFAQKTISLDAKNISLKSENLTLKNDNCELKIKLLKQAEMLQHFHEEYERLLHIIKVANRALYGQKSERQLDEEYQQLSLLETTESITVKDNEAEQTQTISYERHKRSKKDKHQNIPHREIIIAVAEEDRFCHCGCEKKLIRYESHDKIHFQPAVFEIQVEKREVLACPKGCSQSIVTAELPKVALPKVCATEELLSHIAVSKILDRQPLYHLEKQFASRYKIHISRKVMANWMIRMSAVVQPILNLLKESLLSYDVAALDATPLQVLKEPGRLATIKSAAYCMRGGPPGQEVVLYEYNAEKHKLFLADYFLEYEGYLHSDADPLFEDLPNDGKKKLSYCNSHSRRKFEQVSKTAKRPGLAKEAMGYYKRIYKVEREAKDLKLTFEERYQLRLKKTAPILEELRIWLDEQKDKVLPKSPLGGAIQYCRRHWSELTKFLEDGRLEVDNNLTEQQIKYFVMGRKNFLFAETVNGAEALMNHYGLMLTAKVHGLDPFKYYVAILKRLPHCTTIADFEELLPWNIKAI